MSAAPMEIGDDGSSNDKPIRHADNWHRRRGRYNVTQRSDPGDVNKGDKRKWDNVEDRKTIGRREGSGERDDRAEENKLPEGRGGYGSRFRRRGGPRTANESDFLNYRLSKTVGTSTLEIPSQELVEKKFNSRCKLFIGNLPSDITEDEIGRIFAPYGDTSDLFLNKNRGFGFIKMDYRSNAEKARKELDGYMLRNKNLRLRFSQTGTTIKVKNLTSYVTNELLTKAFSIFGEVEWALVKIDERGNNLKEGYVQFTKKSQAQSALSYCSEGCFFLTADLKPVIVEPFEPESLGDIGNGFSEKCITYKGRDFVKARETAPRFAQPGSFEYVFALRWKQIYELYKQKEESLKRERMIEEERLEAQLEYAKFEHETETLREQLRKKEMSHEKQKMEWEMRERQAEELRARLEEATRRHQEQITWKILHQEEELRRKRQENRGYIFTGESEQQARDYAGIEQPMDYPEESGSICRREYRE